MHSTLSIDYETLKRSELAEAEADLIRRARIATHTSHSPYSQFRVGCAVRLDGGSVFTGANQENASYGATVCAERTTVLSVFNEGLKKLINTVAVTGRIGTVPESEYRGNPVMPCGICRQVLKEAEDLHGSPLIILCDGYNDDKIIRLEGIASLLPFGFSGKDFGVDLNR